MNIQSLKPEEFLSIPFKRKWWILTSVVLCVALGYVVWHYFPKTFKSTVVMTIDSPRIAKEYVKGVGQEGKYSEDPAAIVGQLVTLGLTSKSILMPVLETLKPYPDAENASPDQLMKRLRRAVTVGKPKDGVGVTVSYVNPDPYMAQAVTALLAVKFQEDNLKRRENLVENTMGFISGELERAKEDLEVKERAILDFKRAHMGELPQQLEANLRTLDRLQADLTNSTESLNKREERLTAIEKSIKDVSELAPTGIVTFDRDLRVGDARPVDSRLARLREMKQRLNELLGIYKESYPDVVHIKEEIRRAESSLQAEVSKNIGSDPVAGKNEDSAGNNRKQLSTDPYLRELAKERNDVKSEIAFLKEKQTQVARLIKEFDARVEHTPTREQGLTVLLRDYDNMQKSYQALLDKRTTARILENYENRQFGEQFRIIEPASFPDVEEPPAQIHFLLGGLAVGCLIGFGSAIGIEIMKPGFRRPEEVESYLGLPVIASIPSFSSAMGRIGMKESRALLSGPGITGGATKDVPSYLGSRERGAKPKLGKRDSLSVSGGLSPKFHLISKWGPASLVAEQYRVAATRLILMTSEKKNAVTLVTSSVMSEGKTTTAVNLAHVLAHDLGKSTLLIDCDFKRPKVHEYMGIPAGIGLGDALQGDEILENCIHQCDDVPLWILPSGSPKVRPAGLSGIQYVKKVLPELKLRYDHVILDGPPVMPLADINILGAMADMTVFVVRAGGTSQDIARKALRALGEHSEAAGIILTQVEAEHAPYFTYAAAYTNENSGG